MKTLTQILQNTILFTILFMLTTALGGTILITLAQRGGAGAAVVIAASSILGNLILLTFLAIKYKLKRQTILAGAIALILFLPTALLLKLDILMADIATSLLY